MITFPERLNLNCKTLISPYYKGNCINKERDVPSLVSQAAIASSILKAISLQIRTHLKEDVRLLNIFLLFTELLKKARKSKLALAKR